MPGAPSGRAGAAPPWRAAGAAGRPVDGGDPGVCGRPGGAPPAAGMVGPPVAGAGREGALCPDCAGRAPLAPGAAAVPAGGAVAAPVVAAGASAAGGAERAAGAVAVPPGAPVDGTAGRAEGVAGRGDVVEADAPDAAGAGATAAGRPGAPPGRPGWAGRVEVDPLATPAGASPLPGASAGNASRSLRTTGASMVEDGDLTNSPRSWSFAMISLLVLPSSFASSCTRALPATALLTVRPSGLCGPRVLLVGVPGAAHCCFTACSRWVDLLSVPGGSCDRTGTRVPGRSDPLVRLAPRDRGADGPCWCRVVR